MRELDGIWYVVWIGEAEGTAGVTGAGASLNLGASGVRLDALGLDGGSVSVSDSQQIRVATTSTVTDSGNFATQTYDNISAGLIVQLRARKFADRYHTVGTIEISRFTDTSGTKTQRVIAVDAMIPRGKAQRLAVLDRGSIDARFAPHTWGFSASASRVGLWLSVLPQVEPKEGK